MMWRPAPSAERRPSGSGPPLYALLVLLSLSTAPAQSPTAALEGTVRDSQGHPVIGATVVLKSGTAEHTTPTGSTGRYRFDALHAGPYTVQAQADGKTSATAGPFTLPDNATKTVDLIVAAQPLEFYDEPNFTVAGVTSAINRGGHGSDTVIRSTETLAKATASLGAKPPEPATEQSLRTAVARNPQNAAAHHALADFEERSAAHPLEAAREYQRAAELDASETNLFDWGSELLTHRAADQSVAVFSKGHRLFPHSTRMLLGLGAAFYARGAYGEAAQRFFEATDLDPADPAPYLFLGNVRNAEITSLDGYLERMARFAQLSPSSAQANYLYATALWNHSAGDARVEALLDRAIRLDPSLGDAYLQLGIVQDSLGRFPQAIESFKKAIASHAQSEEEAHYRLAQAYQRIGESASAHEQFEIYGRLSKTASEQAERQRRAIQQFVFDMRTRR